MPAAIIARSNHTDLQKLAPDAFETVPLGKVAA
jgi:hypothetical protein